MHQDHNAPGYHKHQDDTVHFGYRTGRAADNVLMEATGRGHYVGCNLSIHNRTGGWWGEGDDRIYVDGEVGPSLHGTGSEDYFGGAWASGENFTQPFSGPYFATRSTTVATPRTRSGMSTATISRTLFLSESPSV